jgi:membrane protein DedA with SNARE-associated domain
MNIELIIVTYGYPAILMGTFLEGETILVIGGFAAYQGYLSLGWVITAAFIGSLMGDQLFFYLGCKHNQKVLARWPSWKFRAEKVHNLLDRFNTPLILAFRFFYGMRTVTPFAMGMSAVSTRKFIILNGIGALVWAVVIGSGGYLFGHVLESVIGKVRHYELRIMGLIVATGILVWILHFFFRRKKIRSCCKSS